MTKKEYNTHKKNWQLWLAAFERAKYVLENKLDQDYYVCLIICKWQDDYSHYRIRDNAIKLMQIAAPNIKWWDPVIIAKPGTFRKRLAIVNKTIAYIKNILATDYAEEM